MADVSTDLILAHLNRVDEKFDSVLSSILELKQRVVRSKRRAHSCTSILRTCM